MFQPGREVSGMVKQTVQKRRKPRPRLIVQRVFIGEKSMEDALFPIIYEDLRRQLERRRTLDKDGGNG